MPFLGDALVLVYYPELGQIVNLEDVLDRDGQIVFSAGNPQGLVGLSLYASAGGEILDAQGLPMLDQEVLTRVLTLVEEGVSKEVFPPSLANVTNETQTLQIYRTGSAKKAIVWSLIIVPPKMEASPPCPVWIKYPFLMPQAGFGHWREWTPKISSLPWSLLNIWLRMTSLLR